MTEDGKYVVISQNQEYDVAIAQKICETEEEAQEYIRSVADLYNKLTYNFVENED